MIGRVLEQSKALSQVLSADKKTRHLVPTWQDTDVLESINNALGPLQEFTDALSGEAYASVSYLKPVLHLLRTSTLTESDEDTNLTKEIKTRALGYIEDKYSDPATQELLDITSFLDPRFKTDYVSAENVRDIKERVKIEMEQVARKVTCPLSLCSLVIQNATSIQVIFFLLSFFNVYIECPIALYHIRLQNFDSSYLCFSGKEGSCQHHRSHAPGCSRGRAMHHREGKAVIGQLLQEQGCPSFFFHYAVGRCHQS